MLTYDNHDNLFGLVRSKMAPVHQEIFNECTVSQQGDEVHVFIPSKEGLDRVRGAALWIAGAFGDVKKESPNLSDCLLVISCETSSKRPLRLSGRFTSKHAANLCRMDLEGAWGV